MHTPKPERLRSLLFAITAHDLNDTSPWNGFGGRRSMWLSSRGGSKTTAPLFAISSLITFLTQEEEDDPRMSR
jgi:hypothetical protein